MLEECGDTKQNDKDYYEIETSLDTLDEGKE